ncbi:MASE3 domain-containing protein [Litchfieldia alkalitelluris]|uniref:MASE3 domain-containing protein n=1 Tax=Litchfieldia alkalitelluris TaxID=304268 RepID=UPI0009976882|nr:MASE3 domain-containing protein [Litchfieldia alkalitelluris]
MDPIERQRKESKVVIYLLLTCIAILLINIYQTPLHTYYHGLNQATLHTLLELFSIFACFSISSYGWQAYNDTKTTNYLWIPSIFFAVGFLDLMHTFTLPGMPYFFGEASNAKTTWFWITSRYTAAFTLLYLIFSKDRASTVVKRGWFIFGTFLYVGLISFVIFKFEHQLPILLNDLGPTVLKNNLEYSISLILLLTIIAVLIKYQKTKNTSELDLVLAFSFLFISELMITLYNAIQDINLIFAHLSKAMGYGFIFKYFYLSRLRLSFQQKYEAEVNLRKTQGILESVFLNTPDSMIILDPREHILRANEAFYQLFQLSKNDVVGRQFRTIVPEYTHILEDFTQNICTRQEMDIQVLELNRNGNKQYIKMSLFPVKNEHGHMMYISLMSRDVTKQIEDELRIQEAEQDLKDTIRLQQGLIMKFRKQNDRFILTLCDGAILRVFKVKPEDLIGRDLFDLVDATTALILFSNLNEAWEGAETSYEINLFNRTFFGTLKPVKRDGVVVEVIGSNLDVTKLKKAEELLQKSEKLAVVGELAAGLAHEIRNPLTALKGFTQLLESTADHSNKPYIDIMLRELDRIEMITNEFMVVAKPQAVKYQPYKLEQLINEVVSFSSPQALLHKVDLLVDFKATNSNVYCDANQLKQVLINLIKNAFEAMPNGGNLKIELVQRQHDIVIRIMDNGIGIPKEILPKLGEPFYTLKEKGTGLGLMVSYRIIEAHKGSITFDSEVNIGTTVEITLPLLVNDTNMLYA